MANKKKKNDDAAAKKPTEPVAAVSTAPILGSAATMDIDVAYAAGNYARVRFLARTNPSEHAAKVKALTDVDMMQVLVGAGAILVVALAAFLTLH